VTSRDEVERGTAFLWHAQAKAASRGIPLAARTPKDSGMYFFVIFLWILWFQQPQSMLLFASFSGSSQ
jgi:hypothetical protein